MARPRKSFTVADLDDGTVIRYDGDPDVFTALFWAHAIDVGLDHSIEPPEPRLWRWNPDPTGEYNALLRPEAKRGPGVWLGALAEVGTWFDPPD